MLFPRTSLTSDLRGHWAGLLEGAPDLEGTPGLEGASGLERAPCLEGAPGIDQDISKEDEDVDDT